MIDRIFGRWLAPKDETPFKAVGSGYFFTFGRATRGEVRRWNETVDRIRTLLNEVSDDD